MFSPRDVVEVFFPHAFEVNFIVPIDSIYFGALLAALSVPRTNESSMNCLSAGTTGNGLAVVQWLCQLGHGQTDPQQIPSGCLT